MMLLQLPTDQMILEELQDGRNLGANIAEDIDRHRKTVTKRLNQLEDYELVRNVGRGVYEITLRGEIALANIDEYDRETTALEELIEAEHQRQSSDESS
ncbi:phage repressor protein [Halorussus halobius]|uniref:phage repressor protein n=1 Tax=Halorussus halobius TaxID=1710537 RepID=UPI001B2FF8E7|nr:phage repressor protein [Halorussus halobius]